MECQLLWLLLLSVQSLNQYLNDILYNSFQHTAEVMCLWYFFCKREPPSNINWASPAIALNRALPNALNCLYALLTSHINMIGVSGGRQSLYTSRPWGLKPLTELYKACLKSSWKKKSMTLTYSLEPAAIWLTLECLQESARQSGCFLLAFFKYLYP